MDQVSDARCKGDKDACNSVIAAMMKLVGNSAFRRSGMDKSKHKLVKYETGSDKVDKMIKHFNFHDMEELSGAYDTTKKKRTIELDNPIYLSIGVYQLVKLRMLQFYYDCIHYYFNRSDFQYQGMDTDSAYIVLSEENSF
uniref:Chromodomain protein putative n=1 Tax=Albugo laibachii Nc14 TaxID=890382 RepID=F0WUN1_9STRA|nr:chromodomain protein putative [Albugo laibachii Nc14]|eukprot:CCA25112.1 chromodomain protein putative [Albugo laibachii Nc14]